MFSKKGFDIYRFPPRELCKPGTPPESGLNVNDTCSLAEPSVTNHGTSIPTFQISWPFVPRPYPPGDVLYHFGIASLYTNSLIDFSGANWLTIELYLLTAHLVFGLFAFLLLDPQLTGSTKINQKLLQFFILSLLFSVYCILMIWSMNGFYDPISILFLLFSLLYYRKKQPTEALLFFSLGLFFHYRALWALPLFIFILWDFYLKRHSIFTIRNIMIIILSLGIISISLYSFALQFIKFYDYLVNNPIFLKQFSDFNVVLVKLLPFFAIFLVLLKFRLYLLASLCAWQLYMLTQMPSIQSWYILFLIVFLAVAGTESRAKTIALFLIFTFVYLENNTLFGGIGILNEQLQLLAK